MAAMKGSTKLSNSVLLMNASEHQRIDWFNPLSTPPPLPKLPLDKEPPPVSSFLRETMIIKLTPDLSHSVKNLATHASVTPQAVLLAALNTLLFRYTGQTDLVVGTIVYTNSHRHIGPLRTQLAGHLPVLDLLHALSVSMFEASAQAKNGHKTAHHASQSSGEGLFNVALFFDEPCNQASAGSGSIEAEQLMPCALVIRAFDGDRGLDLHCEYDIELFEATTIQRLIGHFENLLTAMTNSPQTALERLNLLGEKEQKQLLVEWNATATEIPEAGGFHLLIEAQAEKTPDAVAVVCRDCELTYAELNQRANQLAAYLVKIGAGPDKLIGLCIERSLDMMVGLLGILKSGSAYVPLDPAYPAERLRYMIEDARVEILLTQERLQLAFCPENVVQVRLDADWPLIAAEPTGNVGRGVAAHHLAYVIYTSGSSGRPKGVMIEHGNVLNFFAGMDARIVHGPGSTWLAVTSPSFDISVLELFWTLARGFKVVIYSDDEAASAKPQGRNGETETVPAAHRPSLTGKAMEFSLFYFSSNQADHSGGAYKLLTEGARFADENGFTAVWTPERHFHEFGGLFPNPSVTSAALAMITKRVQIRAGSVVAPLHSPIRIAEEWSVVDNLSNGRVAISFASGWMPEDFAVKPETYHQRKEVMLRDIETVRQLWRGDGVPTPGPLGKDVTVKIFPRPVQPELPVWLTAASNPETFQIAGKLGLNVLTHLLGQSIEEMSKKVALYRQAWSEAGHTGRGHVTLMMHTFVGDDQEEIKEIVRGPLINYLRSAADLIKGYAWAFSAFKHNAKSKEEIDFSTVSQEEMDALLAHSFERYFESSGLFGTPESCVKIIERLRANDVDEIACLVDFGVEPEVVLAHLKHLNALRQASETSSARSTAVDLSASRISASALVDENYSVPALIQRHHVSHLQCTPTMAGMLLEDRDAHEAFQRLQCLMIGGEAFPAALARQLTRLVKGEIINMYGPTETTIWSSTYRISSELARISVGHPIANTEMYILDQNLLPVPIGVIGELMIGGAGVARGYLGRGELTAQRFIQNPFQNNGHGRLYRTGDLARYLPTGDIEILGRSDQQVKIRGHRVELGEIEALLGEYSGVRECVVVARETARGEKRLVAYAISHNDQVLTARQLRDYARKRMPEHMVPSHFVFLVEFPKTPNQKIDRKALPQPDADWNENENEFEPPATEIEKAIALLWSELLDVQRIGRKDNFFETGGDSLSAMQLIHKLHSQFGVDMSLKLLFEHPTVAGLAETVEALSWLASEKPAPAINGEREEVEV